MDREARRATVPGVTKSQTQLSDQAHTGIVNDKAQSWFYASKRK